LELELKALADLFVFTQFVSFVGDMDPPLHLKSTPPHRHHPKVFVNPDLLTEPR